MSELEKEFDQSVGKILSEAFTHAQLAKLIAILKQERDELRDKITLLEGAINILRE